MHAVVDKIPIKTVIFNMYLSFRHPCMLVDDAWVKKLIKVLVEVLVINVWADVVIDALSGLSVDAIIGIIPDVGVEVLTDRIANVNVLVTAITDV